MTILTSRVVMSQKILISQSVMYEQMTREEKLFISVYLLLRMEMDKIWNGDSLYSG